MTNIDTAQIKKHAFGISGASTPNTGQSEDSIGATEASASAANASPKVKRSTKKASNKKAEAKPALKVAAPIVKPSQTIEQAIVSGVPPKELDKLLKAWKAYNLYQAEVKAKVDNDALANAIEERRRKIAEELLEYVHSQGLSVAEARRMLTDASEADGGEDLK